MGFGIAEEVLQAAPRLEWVHSGSAGVGSSLTPEMCRRPLVFTNSAGIHGPPMAEAVLGMIFHFSRGFDFAQANKVRGRWDTEPYYAADAPLPPGQPRSPSLQRPRGPAPLRYRPFRFQRSPRRLTQPRRSKG